MRQTNFFYLLVHPHANNSWHCSKQKPGTWNSTQQSYLGGSDPNSTAITRCLPGPQQQETEFEIKVRILTQALLYGMWVPGKPSQKESSQQVKRQKGLPTTLKNKLSQTSINSMHMNHSLKPLGKAEIYNNFFSEPYLSISSKLNTCCY